MKTTQNSVYKQTRSRFNNYIYEAPISMKIRLQAMVIPNGDLGIGKHMGGRYAPQPIL